MTDLEIRDSVLAALESQPDVHASAIGVAAHQGIVTLSGRITSFAEKAAAVRAAIRAPGVRGLADELDVCDEEESGCIGEVIAARIADFLKASGAGAGAAVKVEVDHGWVHLSGTVESADQRALLESYARIGDGVLGVDNRIRLSRGAPE